MDSPHLFGDEINLGDGDEHAIFVDPELEASSFIRKGSHGSTSSESTIRSSGESVLSKASTTSSPPANPPPPKRRRTRKNKSGSKTAQDVEKRSKFLERNRVAASKCRQKKKEYVAGLEETKADLETLNSHLTMERTKLLDELARMKNYLMLHADCNDHNINNWLMTEARHFVQSSMTDADALLPARIKPEEASPREVLMNFSDLPFIDLDLEPEKGDNSFSQPTSLLASPTELVFPRIDTPLDEKEPEINYDHMPDSMFA